MQINYQWPEVLYEGVFKERVNRFVAKVMIDSQEQLVHVPNSGRMRELLLPDAKVWCVKPEGTTRKTAYSLLLVETQAGLVCINAQLPNLLVGRALAAGRWPELGRLLTIKPERKYGASRFDFYIEGSKGVGFIETKSVTLVVDDQARFPDAPTERGVKHLEELITVRAQGMLAGVIFVIQRQDATSFGPNDQTHPQFGEALRRAFSAGVEIKAISCQVTLTGISLGEEVQIEL